MKPSLSRWIRDADALRHVRDFQAGQGSLIFGDVDSRLDDYYIALVGDLFERLRNDDDSGATDFARLGNALAQLSETQDERLHQVGISATEAAVFASAAFYFGGFPASAYLTMKAARVEVGNEASQACFDLLARPRNRTSVACNQLVEALRSGNMDALNRVALEAARSAKEALPFGPDAWIPARLFEVLTRRFMASNVRSVLPNGSSSFWTPFVASLLSRNEWEFFPSQVQALQRGLLERDETFSLQMPTGAGKTALCETLLYWHTGTRADSVAVLLVPYRSLASELRGTIVQRLNQLGIPSRCVYGGSVSTSDERKSVEDARVIVATPEALLGLIGASIDLYQRISLVICDEGHLLDTIGRGVALELLLARMRTRLAGAPRFVFVSAIVPNIEEIHAWLGGGADTVIRSDYRPAIAEYAVLRTRGKGARMLVDMDMHPHEVAPQRFAIEEFLSRSDFTFLNADTGRSNTYRYSTVKTLAIATARKALRTGVAAVFAANKGGDQGAVGLADEIVSQLSVPLPLPAPITFANLELLAPAVDYFVREYGPDWIGTRALDLGVVLHHGDVPQESREVLERLLRLGGVRLVICTTTLAEGVNLPIRTLVLYSVSRRQRNGPPERMLARDIKNLVGRAGRAGSTTKGLVVTANADQWSQVEHVAKQAQGEEVRGALRTLIERLSRGLGRQIEEVTNTDLEDTPGLHSLIDGIDATLIELVAQEIGEAALVAEAVRLADQTFASQRADAPTKALLRRVFALRARRVEALRGASRLGWIRETGARPRLLESVEAAVFSQAVAWNEVTNPLDPSLVRSMLGWAWVRPEMQEEIRTVFRIDDASRTDSLREPFFVAVSLWIGGEPFRAIAPVASLDIDGVLHLFGRVVSFVLQSLVEQAIALLGKVLQANGQGMSEAVEAFPEHLRFGVPSRASLVLSKEGVRHRSASVALGNAIESTVANSLGTASAARELLVAQPEVWQERLGRLVYSNTLTDLGIARPE